MPRAPRKTVLTVVGVVAPTWPAWYNAQKPDRQAEFDSKVSVLDRGGVIYDDWLERLRVSDPELFAQIQNYRETGGRRALFTPQIKDYGQAPISKATPGGPIESAGAIVALHPGRYTYSATHDVDGAFRAWLNANRETVAIGAKQVSEAATLGAPYYTDYEFRVWKDTPWASTVPGLPTWLPEGYSLEKYWGKPTEHAKPDWEALDKGLDFGKTALTLVIVAGAVYLLGELRPRQIARG